LLLTLVYMIAEAAGGWLSNSLALLADAGHMLTDVGALGLTLGAIWFASRPATRKKTFGFYRMEILAAFVNGIVLVLLSIWVIYEAVMRWQAPPAVSGGSVSIIAGGGLIVNIIAAFLLRSGSKQDLNMRGAWLHVMGDLVGSVAAIAAGVLILTAGWLWADPASSIFISLIIVIGAGRLVLESVNVLLEGTPAHIDISDVEGTILQVDGVADVHDLHVWTISSGREALSAHVRLSGPVDHAKLLSSIRESIHDKFEIDHMTIQMEKLNKETEAIYVCETGTKCFKPAGRG
jgi:cobalt-zinc-cadmium efflux system protein